jgi:hypothetical protein
MKAPYYFAAWTDSDCLLGCDHEHKTVTSAAACISSVGGYVVAVTKGRLRELDDTEEAEFQRAMCGTERETKKAFEALRSAILEPLT